MAGDDVRQEHTDLVVGREDLREALALARELYGFPETDPEPHRAGFESLVSDVDATPFLAIADGEVAGFIGFLISNAIGDSVGGGAFIVGLIVAGAAYMTGRGSKVGRAFIGLSAAAVAVVGVIYAFVGPGSAVIPSLVIAALSAGTFALLYLSASAKEFYARR